MYTGSSQFLMPVITGQKADSEADSDVATMPVASPMPSESPDIARQLSSNSSASSSHSILTGSTTSLRSDDGPPEPVVMEQSAVELKGSNVIQEREPSNKLEQLTAKLEVVEDPQVDIDKLLLQTDVGGATLWSTAPPTVVSQLPSQYLKMSSYLSTSEVSETDHTLATEATEQQDGHLLSTNDSVTSLSSDGVQQLDDMVEHEATPVPTSQPSRGFNLRSSSLPSINLASTLLAESPRAHRVGSLTNVLRRQGDGLESLTVVAPTTTSDTAATSEPPATTTSAVPITDRPLLDGENVSDDSKKQQQQQQPTDTTRTNVLEREGPLVGADSDNDDDDDDDGNDNVSSSTPSETNFLTDNQPFSLLDHQLQFSLFEPSNLDALMARDSLLASLRPPVTAGQEKVTGEDAVSLAGLVCTAGMVPHSDILTTSLSTNIQSHTISTDSLAILQKNVKLPSVTRTDFLHGSSKPSEVERPTAVGFTEWDKSPSSVTSIPSTAAEVVASSQVLVTTDTTLPYLQPQESDSESVTTSSEVEFGSDDAIQPAESFSEMKDANSFLKELEQDEMLANQDDLLKVHIIRLRVPTPSLVRHRTTSRTLNFVLST